MVDLQVAAPRSTAFAYQMYKVLHRAILCCQIGSNYGVCREYIGSIQGVDSL